MEQREKYTVTVERERTVRIMCDRCYNEIVKTKDMKSPDFYKSKEVELRYTEKESWGGDGGTTVGWQVEHLCDDCVIVLRELLISNGFRLVEIYDAW